MSFIEQWQCEEFDEWWQFDQDCCRWNRGHWRCENWWEDHPELLGDIGYIIAALFVVLLITLCICYSQRKCCFRNCGRQSQNPTHTIPPPNQTVTTVTGNPSQPYTTNNTQPMTSNYPTQGYPVYPSQPQMQPSYPASPPGYNQYQNYSKQPATNPAYGANFGQPNNQYIPPAGSVRY